MASLPARFSCVLLRSRQAVPTAAATLRGRGIFKSRCKVLPSPPNDLMRVAEYSPCSGGCRARVASFATNAGRASHPLQPRRKKHGSLCSTLQLQLCESLQLL